VRADGILSGYLNAYPTWMQDEDDVEYIKNMATGYEMDIDQRMSRNRPLPASANILAGRCRMGSLNPRADLASGGSGRERRGVRERV
jgi:hypothetical protein